MWLARSLASQLANQQEHKATHALLELFAYGTWADYTGKSIHLRLTNTLRGPAS